MPLPPMGKSPAPLSNDEKLDVIIMHLSRMDRRDRLRTIGSFIRGIIGLIPIIIVLAATWYTVKYGDTLLQKITSMAAEQAGRVAVQNSGIVDQLNQFLKK